MLGSTLDPAPPYAISKPTIKKQVLYTPLPTPRQPWESVSMDYMSRLPSTKHENDFIFMVLNKFSKMAIMEAYKKSATAKMTTNPLFEQVWVDYMIP